MSDPLGFWITLIVGSFCATLVSIGLHRGQVVSIQQYRKSEHPGAYWYGIIYQSVIGSVCLVCAVLKAMNIL